MRHYPKTKVRLAESFLMPIDIIIKQRIKNKIKVTEKVAPMRMKMSYWGPYWIYANEASLKRISRQPK